VEGKERELREAREAAAKEKEELIRNMKKKQNDIDDFFLSYLS
jgi:hypothetical protein